VTASQDERRVLDVLAAGVPRVITPRRVAPCGASRWPTAPTAPPWHSLQP